MGVSGVEYFVLEWNIFSLPSNPQIIPNRNFCDHNIACVIL